MSIETDVLVVGGGPAGLAAGVRARQEGMTVTLVEPKSPPIDKACGEGLMPSGLSALSSLGVDLPDGHPISGIHYVDAEDPTTGASAEFPDGVGRGVRRTRLHRAMWRRAQDIGVRWLQGRVTEIEQVDDGVRAAGTSARWLIAADGLHSTVRKKLELEEEVEGPTRYGIRRHFRIAPWSDRVEVWWRDGCEAYVTPVGERRVGIAFLYSGGARFEELMGRFPALVDRLDGAEPVSKARGGGIFRVRSKKKATGRCLLVGDAAGYADALTGEGVSIGVRTAMRAVDAIAEGAPSRYEAAYWREAGPYLAATDALLRLTRDRRIHEPMIRFLQAYPVVFRTMLGWLGGDESGQSAPPSQPRR